MAVILAGVELSGCRTSGVGGNGATVHNRENPWVLQVHRSAASTLVMLGRADELRSMELVGRGGGELRRRWGTGLEQEREQERRGNRSMSSLWLQSASQWARGRPGDGESGRRSSMPVGEDGGDGVTAGLLVLLGAVGRKSRSRRSFGRRRGGEAVAVAAANGVGGDGGARAERTEEGESVRGRERKVQGVQASCWRHLGATRGSQAG